MSEMPHVLFDRLEPLSQRRLSGVHGDGFFGRVHALLLLRGSADAKYLEVERGKSLRGLESSA